MFIAIPSSGRSGTASTHLMIPSGFYIVPENQKEDYLKIHDKVITHPVDMLPGMGQKRKWIIDNIQDEIIFMVDDDLEYVASFENRKDRRVHETIKDPEHILAIVSQTAEVASELGAHLFGYFEIARKGYYIQNCFKPFVTKSRINGFAIGHIKPLKYNYDPRLIVKQDFDISLKAIYHDRYVWVDKRYCFKVKHYTNPGGLTDIRTMALENECRQILQKRYGKSIVKDSTLSEDYRTTISLKKKRKIKS